MMVDTLDRIKAALADRYAIKRELGRGGMATVYLAQDRKHDRQIALKVLLPELAASLGAERFLREIRIAAKLTHSHILALHDSGEADGHLFYVMPYIEGESLRDRLNREGQLPVEDAVRIATEVADALGSAHRQNVIHRDIKPGNILLQEGHAVVADFGIARAVTAAAEERLTETGLAVGTPIYMSPEQASADDVDGRSDIYALGCVLYEMLAGEPPFDGATAAHIIRKHISAEVIPVSVVRPSVPESLSSVVAKALAKEPADRFADAEQFSKALRAIGSPEPQGAHRAGKTAYLPRPVAATVAVVAVVIAGWFAFSTLFSDKASVDSIAVLPFANFTGDVEKDHIVLGIHSALISNLGELSAFSRVIARQSVTQFSNTTLSISEIADLLDVDVIVEGSVSAFGDSVQIAVQLSEGATDRRMWSNEYNGNLRNVLGLQNEVTRAIANEIRLTLTMQEDLALASTTPVVNPEAYELAMMGWQQLNLRWIDQAEESFSGALERDSTFASAYVGLATALNLPYYGSVTLPEHAFPRARDAASTALRLDSTIADAYVELAWAKAVFDWDWSGAESDFRRALALNPASSQGHSRYAFLLHWQRRYAEAVAELERSIELDPLAVGTGASTANTFRRMRMCDRAVGEAERTQELARVLHIETPRDPVFVIGICHVQDGRFVDGIELMKNGVESAAPALVPQYKAELAHALAVSGNQEEARELLAEVLAIERTQYVPPYLLAMVYAGLGDNDSAFDWLEQAIDVRDSWLAFLNVEPRWDSIRDDPRFAELLRTLNFM